MVRLRPSDLAREHGLSAQAVRNYERDGFIPAAERTRTGYRVYTEVHAAALRAFLALSRAYGRANGGEIMQALARGDLDGALTIVDRGHEQLLRDRGTLDAVRAAVERVTAGHATAADRPAAAAPYSIGELAHRLRVTPATLRNWEEAGVLRPERDRVTGYRRYEADDVRDAELAHLLRRGGYPLDHIASVVRRVRIAGGAEALAGALVDWRRRLSERGVAMLEAAAALGRYLDALGGFAAIDRSAAGAVERSIAGEATARGRR